MLDRVLRPGPAARAARRVGLRRPRCAAHRETEGLIDEAAIAAMKPAPGSSTSRAASSSTSRRSSGRCATGRLGGAALDTFRDEPLPPSSPLTTCRT